MSAALALNSKVGFCPLFCSALPDVMIAAGRAYCMHIACQPLPPPDIEAWTPAWSLSKTSDSGFNFLYFLWKQGSLGLGG